MTPPEGSFLITGSTGFIGSRLVERLSDEGATVYCAVYPGRGFDLRLAGLPGVTPVAMSSDHVSWIPVTDISPEVVINLASAGVASDERNLPSTVASNVEIITRLVESLSSHPPKIILHAGSWSEYAVDDHDRPITEHHRVWPLSVYGASKAASAFYGAAIARRVGIPFVNLRLFNVYGPGEAPNRLAPYVIRRLSQRKPAELTPGDQVRDLTFVTDIIEAIWQASQGDLEPFTAYNVCSGVPVAVRTVAETIADLMGRPRDLLRFGTQPHRVDEPPYVVGDNRRFAEATNWSPRVGLGQGLRVMIDSLVQPEALHS